jgi:subfamily B ATP-binding cassette protein MsbA
VSRAGSVASEPSPADPDPDPDSDLDGGARRRALTSVAAFRPATTALIVAGSVLAALLEGVGLSFLLPVLELASGGDVAASSDERVAAFATAYAAVGVDLTLATVVVGVAAVLTLRHALGFLVHWARERLQVEYVRHLRSEAFDALLDAEVAYFDVTGSDELLNAVVTRTERGATSIKDGTILLQQVLLAAVYLGVAVVVSPLLAVIAVGLLGAVAVTVRYVIEPAYGVGGRVADADQRVQTVLGAAIHGSTEVKLFGTGQTLSREFEDALAEQATANVRLRRNEAAVENLYRVLTVLSVLVVLYVALASVGLGIGALGVFLLALFQLAPTLSELTRRLYHLDGELPHLVRTRDLVAEVCDRRERVDGRSVETPVETVGLDGVTFAYDGGREPVLRDVSLTVERGEFVALVGGSGAGKSTALSLLAGLYDPSGGDVLVDGRALTTLDREAWRSALAVVEQDPYVFDDTLRRNLAVAAPDARDAAIERVADAARVTEFLPSLPDGYDTLLGEDGVQLSGGQRQRVALARALLTGARVILLDEATSELDATLESDVLGAIADLGEAYTLVVVAHRLSTVRDADRIYVLDEGRVVESGRHDSLLARRGRYSRLYAAQTGGVGADADSELGPGPDTDRETNANADGDGDGDPNSTPDVASRRV